jgi:hypothetical protein
MRWLAILTLALMQSATPHHTIFVVDKVLTKDEARTNSGGGVTASTQVHHTGPVVMAEFMKKCPSVSFTQDQAAADLILQTQSGATILSDSKGSVLYVSPAKTLKNMVKDVCGFVASH